MPAPPPAPPAPARARRTQAERREATRTALLDAAVELLAERGYAGLSTTEVARRAGVSRGAQLHHFPARAELVEAAIDHAYRRREQAFRDRFAALPASAHTESTAVQLLWEVTRSTSHDALYELALAARTDIALRPVVRQAALDAERAIVGVFAELFPDAADDPFVAVRVRVAMAVLQSATLHHQLGLEAEAAELVATLELLTDLVPIGTDPATEGTGP